MSGVLMDAVIAAAIDAGRSIIVPTAQRAAALRWNWARAQRASGREVWATPDVLTWEAWLDSRWRQARHGVALRRLNRAQQRELWERVLRGLGERFGDEAELALHAPALMRAAAKASQSLLMLSRSAVSEEEQLLAAALEQVRHQCERLQAIALPLATPEQLAPILDGPPPLIVGEPRLTALQQVLGERCWPQQPLLHCAEPAETDNASASPKVVHVRAADLEAEIAACAQWFRGHLEADGSRRLLVVSAVTEPSLRMQGVMLWRALSQGTGIAAAGDPDPALLAVEGGAPLAHQALVADALAALRLACESIAWIDLSRVLRSAYLQFDEPRQALRLEATLGAMGRAHWPRGLLRRALLGECAANPAAQQLSLWLEAAQSWPRAPAGSAMQWAQRFSQWLRHAGFARAMALQSGEAQRLARWGDLLDEFASVDAVAQPLSLDAALARLQQLAHEIEHAPESGDAAISLSAFTGAPVARYDGIWVLGLTEQRWPQPPRPNPYVALGAQRHAHWEESSAQLRLERARWVRAQWQANTSELVLSHALREGDLRHRPATLLSGVDWITWPERATEEPLCTAPMQRDDSLPAMVAAPNTPLPRALQRLRLQQQCPFRAQAQVRLGAEPPVRVGEGIDPRLRGELLHSVLEGIWQELGGQAGLLRLSELQRLELISRHWSRAVSLLAKAAFTDGRQLERERLRAEHLLLRVFEMDAARPPFQVVASEQQLQSPSHAGILSLRLDRIDVQQDQWWLIDYKSGRPESLRLERGSAQPLQLALYEQALTQAGHSVHGLALLSLNPMEPGYAGIAREAHGWPGRWKSVPDWDTQRELWRAELDRLLREHLQGQAAVAPQRGACRYCHLPALCRRGDALLVEEELEDSREEP